MLYISLLTILFILVFNYNILFYIGLCYFANMMICSCLADNYWMNSSDICLKLLGNCIYLCHYLIYIHRESYLVKYIKYIYTHIYMYLSYVNLMIDFTIKKYVISYLISKPKQLKNSQVTDTEFINILQSNLKLIIYIESLNIQTTDDQLDQLLKQSKIKIYSYMKKHLKKTKNSILEDIKQHNI